MLENIFERRVACAALRWPDGFIICGPRHYHPIMRAAIEAAGRCKLQGNKDIVEQGFVDFQGVWLTREEAYIVAKDAKQIVLRCGSDDEKLFSENLG